MIYSNMLLLYAWNGIIRVLRRRYIRIGSALWYSHRRPGTGIRILVQFRGPGRYNAPAVKPVQFP